MAHFAELDSNNKVLRVIVISNDDVNANGGDQSTGAETFVTNLAGLTSAEESPTNDAGVSWKQCSYNRSFRKYYPGGGGLWNYDPTLDMFYHDQPHPGWTRDENGEWESPVSRPTDVSGKTCVWDESNNKWKGIDLNDASEYLWNNDTNSWDAI